MNINRRQAFAFVAGVAATASIPSLAAPAKVPVIWDGQKMYDTFAKDGTGFSAPGPDGRKKAFVAFDTQCPDCIRLMDRIAPLYDQIEVVYFPIAFMNEQSVPQAAMILSDKNPFKKLEEHHAHFRDPGFRGLQYGDVNNFPLELRNKVWLNAKLHRRSGCRAVPYGVFKNSKGEYVPFDENLSTKELAEIFEISY